MTRSFILARVVIILHFYAGYVNCALLFSDDPDIYRNVTSFITSRGFQWESYEVITNDGYILTIFRIVNPYINRAQLKPRPVLLWHGLQESADKWVFNRKGRLNSNGVYSEDNGKVVNKCRHKVTSTLSFTLSACGFDVWLANFRGNQYANRNVNFTDQDPRFWQYSITELGLYDITATVSRVLQITQKDDLSYIGFSLGNEANFVLLSLRPEFEQYFRPFIALAPVAFEKYATSITGVLAPFEPLFRLVAVRLGISRQMAQFIGAFICGNKLLRFLCLLVFDLVSGKDRFNTDKSRLPTHFAHFLDYQSSRILIQQYQIQNSNRFAFFDYGEALNLVMYNQAQPPNYPLERITSRDIYLFNGKNDKRAAPGDVRQLYDIIKPNVKLLRTNPCPRWTHLDVGQAKFENKFQDRAILKILLEYN